MILKTRPGEKAALLLLGAVILLSGLAWTRRSLEAEIYAAYDPLMSLDLGFSSLNRVGDGLPEVALNFMKAIPVIIKAKTVGIENQPEIPQIDLNIKFEDYQTILADREKGRTEGFLRDPSEVNARLVYKGKNHKAEVRLKGDISDHWRSRHRMSLRVDLKGDDTIMGFKSFSIHKPAARQHPFDQVYQDMARDSGNLSAVHKYARITVNGTPWGIMNIEEHMSKELLEKQRSKDSLIMRFSNEDYFLYREEAEHPYQRYLISENNFYTKPYSAKKYFADDVSRRRYSYASRLLLEERFDELFDEDSLMRSLLLTSAWGNFHTIAPSNSRYYFNPYDLKLHPITTDQGRPYDIKEREKLFNNPVYEWLLDAPNLDEVAERNVTVVEEVVGKAKERFGLYNKIFPVDKEIDTSLLFQNMEFISNDPTGFVKEVLTVDPREKDVADYVFDFGQGVILSAENDENRPPSIEQVREMMDFVHLRHFDDGTVEIYNLLPIEVQLTALLHNGAIVEEAAGIVPPYGPEKTPRPLVIHTGILGMQDGLFSAETELLGVERTTSSEYTLVTEDLANPLNRSFPRESLPFLEEAAGNFTVKRGTWHIRSPLTLDGDLTIPPGTELLFSPDAYLIVKGSLTTLGTEEDPVRILPEADEFKGIYVFKASSASRLSHTIFGRTSGVVDGLLQLTGGVTFYLSDVEMNHVTFLGTSGEDALNTVRSNIVLNNLHIHDTRSDGFDGDFSTGVIRNSEFSAVGGDAVDFSGSVVEISQLNAHGIKDKAVSVGEGSVVHVHGGTFRDVGVGLASKDGSYATGDGLQISSYNLHGAMTYTKKSFFIEPELEISNSTVSAGDRFFRQVGSKLAVGGIAMPEREISVKDLYQGPVMKK